MRSPVHKSLFSKRDAGSLNPPPKQATNNPEFETPRSLFSSLYTILFFCLFQEPKYMALLVWHSLTQIPLLLFHQHHKIKHLKTRLVHYSFVNKRGGGGKKELGGRGEGGNDDHDDFHSAVVVQIDKTDDDKLKKNPHHDSSEDSEEEHTTATSNSPPRQEWPWLMTFITGIIRGSAVARIHTIPLARSMTSALLTDLILDGDCRILQTHFNVNREKLLECEKNGKEKG